jgi:DNA-binding FrmR family transcriptional regulator
MSHDIRESHLDEKRKHKLLADLRRIEGQVRGVHKMIEEERYCIDILNQLASIKSAANGICLALLEAHTRGYVKKAIREQTDQGDGHVMQSLCERDRIRFKGFEWCSNGQGRSESKQRIGIVR